MEGDMARQAAGVGYTLYVSLDYRLEHLDCVWT